MALIKCPECDREISDQAKACPNCGHPNGIVEMHNLEDRNRIHELFQEQNRLLYSMEFTLFLFRLALIASILIPVLYFIGILKI